MVKVVASVLINVAVRLVVSEVINKVVDADVSKVVGVVVSVVGMVRWLDVVTMKCGCDIDCLTVVRGVFRVFSELN